MVLQLGGFQQKTLQMLVDEMREKAVGEVARFYYPVRLDEEAICLYYAYEKSDGTYGVNMSYGPGIGWPLTLSQMKEAVRLCQHLNAQQNMLPVHLPVNALRFLLRSRRQARFLSKNGQRFLLLPVGQAAS